MTEYVQINSDQYAVYATVATADLYMAAAAHGATWRAETDDEVKGRALVTATRFLDRQRWKGSKTDPDQPLAWPRSATGLAWVEDDEIPEAIIWASIEIALALLDGSEVQSEQNTGQKIQSLRAGSVSITYFRGAEGQPLRFPLIVFELLRDYLDGVGIGGNAVAGIATGTDGTSMTEQDFGFTRAP